MTAARAPILDLIAHSPEQTRAIAGQLARHLEPGQVVLLSGSLGAGKTTFVQGLARALQAIWCKARRSRLSSSTREYCGMAGRFASIIWISTG